MGKYLLLRCTKAKKENSSFLEVLFKLFWVERRRGRNTSSWPPNCGRLCRRIYIYIYVCRILKYFFFFLLRE
jgi:hypothetical protein